MATPENRQQNDFNTTHNATILPSNKIAARRTLRLAIPKFQQADSQFHPHQLPPAPKLQQHLTSSPSKNSDLHIARSRLFVPTTENSSVGSPSISPCSLSGSTRRLSNFASDSGSICSSNSSSGDVKNNNYFGDSDGFSIRNQPTITSDLDLSPMINDRDFKGRSNYLQ